MTGRDLTRYEPPSTHTAGDDSDALGEYLAHARVWERLPSLVHRDLVRWSAGASLVSLVLGVVGLMLGSSRPPSGFFMVGAATITGLLRVVLDASWPLVGVGSGGLIACLVAASQPSGIATRAVLTGELVTAGVAVTADAMLLAAFVLQLIVWLLIITLLIVVAGAILVAFVAGALEG